MRARPEESQLVVFRLFEEEFGLDILYVREIIPWQNVTALPNSAEFIEGVINLRGRIMAVVDLSKRFNMPVKERVPENKIIIAEAGGKSVGIIVDAVVEVARIARENIELAPEMIREHARTDFIKGVAKIKNRLIVLLGMDKLFSCEEIEQINNTTQDS